MKQLQIKNYLLAVSNKTDCKEAASTGIDVSKLGIFSINSKPQIILISGII